MKDVTPLTDGWTLRHESAALPARVPGCVHTDLLAAGLIPDPFLGRDEEEVAWVGRSDWRYELALGRPRTRHERTDLVFEGLDTVAEIRLGGRLLGRTRNMHRSHRFDLTAHLAAAGDTAGEGDPALSVEFTSAQTAAEAERARLGDRPSAYPEPFPYLRKMACSFGWDWGPTLVTAGIWRPVRLEHWSTARLRRVRPEIGVTGIGSGEPTGQVTVHLDVERTGAAPLSAVVRLAGHSVRADVDGDSARLEIEVPGPDLWWPRGQGAQRLYHLDVTLHDAEGRALDTWSRRIGFRTVRLDTTPDTYGSAFTLVVNGRPLFARGVNWIPDDVFPSRISPERYRTRLRQAAAAGVDLVRVWGGGLYESEDFYQACDELGLMVWQDFPFACAAYPEEEPLRGEVEAEARENVVRLMPHPSLVLWNGNNENLWGFRDWGWEEQLASRSWGEGYYLGLLARVVAELDPTRPYWAGSPWSGSWDHHPNDPAHGTTHSWEVWNRTDYTDYLDQVPRFVAEFGWQAPPALATLRRALPGEELAPDSPGMLHHQRAEDGNGKLRRGLDRHFAEPADFDRWHYLTQLNQARAVATGIEHWRAHWPRCAGTVVWQLNDCWPVTSWSAVDGDGRLKPLHHELRRLYADRLLTLQNGPRGLELCAVNQSRGAWHTPVRLRRLAADGTVLAESALECAAEPDSVARLAVPAPLLPAADSAEEFLVADAEGEPGLRALHFPVRDREFAYPVPEYDLEILRDGTGGGDRITLVVTAKTLLRDLLLQSDRLHPEAVTDTGRLTLLPGESATLTVRGWRPSGEAAAQARAALFSVGQA
ncbi:glycoside hydrolase family 2 protein [Streptomyces physcomitrii]|uniref:beta-mannosidase n=1 Tax=Streptomyces physcomitrii TaxID=2724184 RepID=A0ABX1H4H4_9ACTN|nr:glycoside hydrolase family 2 protein [Streptomyces physcomitrii]NKI42164.1 glycoside hydrolase family 2 protein [Streptomyces physcomitrii]